MIVQFDRPETSKELYFKLNNAFLIADPIRSPTCKVAGLYAIYKDNNCLYVGQSKNLSSRLATHLTGKYEIADRVDLYFICEGFDDFYKRTNQSQTGILENNEITLINNLNPTENVFVDRDADIEDRCLFEKVIDTQIGTPNSNLDIYLNKDSISITDNPYEWYFGMPKQLIDNDHEFKEMLSRTSKGVSNA